MRNGRLSAAALALALSLSFTLAAAPVAAQDDEEEEDADAEEEEEGGEGGDDEADASDTEDAGGQREHADVLFDVHAMLGYYAEVGVGVRVDIPVIDDGLVEGPDDALFLTLGAEVAYVYWSMFEGFAVYPLLAFQWNFYLDSEWSLFPEIGVTLLFGSNREEWFPSFVAPVAAFGVRYHFAQRNAVFVRAGWPTGVQIGLTF
jgi:hypothetical protein